MGQLQDLETSLKTVGDIMTKLIEDGAVIIIQRFQYMRTFSLNLKKNASVQLGNDTVNLSAILGHPYGTAFKMKHESKKQWSLQITQDIPDFEEQFLDQEEEVEEARKDNRDLKDENTSQKLSKEEIEAMKLAGKESKEIISQLIANSETFQKKTKFSQAKFLKKKAKKYHEYILIREPSMRLLMQIFYKKDPVKIMNLRIDSLAQLMNQTNLRSGARVMVYEFGCQGIVVAGKWKLT